MKLFYHLLSRWTLRYWWAILFGSVLMMVSALWITRSLQFRGDFVDLLPTEAQSVKDLNVIRDLAGGEGYLVIVLEGGKLENAKKFADALSIELQKLKEVNYVDYKLDKKFFEDRSLLFVELEDLKTLETRLKDKIAFERNKHNPFYIDLLGEKNEWNIDDIQKKYLSSDIIKDYYLTEKPQRLVMLVKPGGHSNSLDFCKTLLANAQATVASLHPETFDPEMLVKYTGRYVTRIEEVDFMFSDLKRTTIIALIGILLLLFLYTRQKLAPLFVGLPLMMSLVYTMAFATLTIGYLNMITAVLLGILSGMGIDYGIHLYLRYLEERRRHRSLEESIRIIHSSTGKPLILAGLTTAIAFLILIPMSFIGFSQFGLICGGGITLCLINTYIVLPALLVAQERIWPMKRKMTFVATPHEAFLSPRRFPKPYLTVGAFLAICLVAFLGIPFIQFDYDFRKLSADRFGTLKLQEEISDAFGVSLSPTVVYAYNLEDIPELESILKQVQKDHKNTTIDKGLSLYSYVPTAQSEKIPYIRKLGKVAKDKTLRFLEGEEEEKLVQFKKSANANPFSVSDLPKQLKRQFSPVTNHGGAFLFIFPAVDLWHGKEVMRYADEIRDFQKAASHIKIHVASEALIYSDILTLIKSELPMTIILSLLAVFLILWIDLKRISITILVVSPLLVGLLGLLAILFVFGIKINFMNSIVFTILMGLGIDNGVYLYHRYKELGHGSLQLVMKYTGGAIFLSSTTTMIGFGALYFAYHKGLETIGLVAVIGMGSCLISSVLFFPALLQVIEDHVVQPHHAHHTEPTPPLESTEEKKAA